MKQRIKSIGDHEIMIDTETGKFSHDISEDTYPTLLEAEKGLKSAIPKFDKIAIIMKDRYGRNSEWLSGTLTSITKDKYSSYGWVTSQKGDRGKHYLNEIYLDTPENKVLATKYTDLKQKEIEFGKKADEVLGQMKNVQITK